MSFAGSLVLLFVGLAIIGIVAIHRANCPRCQDKAGPR